MASSSLNSFTDVETDEASFTYVQRGGNLSQHPELDIESGFKALDLHSKTDQRSEFSSVESQPDDARLHGQDTSKFSSEQNIVAEEAGAKIHDRGNTVTSDTIEEIPDSEDENVFWQDEDGDTLLHLLIIAGNKEFCLLLVPLMAEFDQLDIVNYLFQTPLHLAAISNQSEIALSLVENGASIAEQDKRGRTPLHIACELGEMDMLKTLLSKEDLGIARLSVKHTLNMKNYEGETCLHLATKKGDTTMTELILSKGADVNVPDGKSKRTALHVAAEVGNVEMAKVLLKQADIDVDIATMAGDSPVVLAYLRDRDEIVELLNEVIR